MLEYEVLVETINPCGGGRHAKKEFIDVETDNPAAWVEQNGRWPIIDTISNPNGDVTIVTGDSAGNIIRYTFSG